MSIIAIMLFSSVLAAASAPSAGLEGWEHSYRQGNQSFKNGDIRAAEAALERAVAITETFSPRDLRRSITMLRLADVYRVEESYFEAEALDQRALQQYQKATGPRSQGFALDLSDLGTVYCLCGHYSQTVEM